MSCCARLSLSSTRFCAILACSLFIVFESLAVPPEVTLVPVPPLHTAAVPPLLAATTFGLTSAKPNTVVPLAKETDDNGWETTGTRWSCCVWWTGTSLGMSFGWGWMLL